MIKTGWYFPADRDAMAKLIYHIKRYRDVDADALFARQGAGLLRPILTELGLGLAENTVIVGVPRSRRAIRKYGHDQARGLAAAWAREMKLPLSTALRRRRTFFFRTQEQKRLRSADRWHNTETAFVWRGGCTVRGKTVILVDDICTTGDTAAACCRQLLEAGATQVFLAVVAQTRDLAREWMRIGHPDGRVTRQAADDAPERTSLGGTAPAAGQPMKQATSRKTTSHQDW